jgi:hypothetical protein
MYKNINFVAQAHIILKFFNLACQIFATGNPLEFYEDIQQIFKLQADNFGLGVARCSVFHQGAKIWASPNLMQKQNIHVLVR